MWSDFDWETMYVHKQKSHPLVVNWCHAALHKWTKEHIQTHQQTNACKRTQQKLPDGTRNFTWNACIYSIMPHRRLQTHANMHMQQKLPYGMPNFKEDAYTCEQHHATSHDGVRVPITIARRRDLAKGGPCPVLMEVYGSYGQSLETTWQVRKALSYTCMYVCLYACMYFYLVRVWNMYEVRKRRMVLSQPVHGRHTCWPKGAQKTLWRSGALSADQEKLTWSGRQKYMVWCHAWLHTLRMRFYICIYIHWFASHCIDAQVEKLSLLDRGWAVAWCHVRGGGELGENWHRQATGLSKLNSVFDAKACAEYLVSARYVHAPVV